MRRQFISKVHTQLRNARLTRRGATTSLGEAQMNLFKEYPRMPRIALPTPPLSLSLGESVHNRASQRGMAPYTPLSLEQAGAILSTLRMKENGTRRYPSGGGMYPIETYLIGMVGNDAGRVLHYHPQAHALEELWSIPTRFTMFDLVPAMEDMGEPSLMLVFSAVWDRSASKYGDFAYILSLLEAGHMAQNILLAASAIGVGARPMEGFNDETVHETLNIDGDTEQAVYVIVLYPN